MIRILFKNETFPDVFNSLCSDVKMWENQDKNADILLFWCDAKISWPYSRKIETQDWNCLKLSLAGGKFLARMS